MLSGYSAIGSRYIEYQQELAKNEENSDNNGKPTTNGYYRFIAMHPNEAQSQIKFAYNLLPLHKQNITFLDVGCGVGNIMAIAQNLNIRVTGIEYNRKVIDKALYPSIPISEFTFPIRKNIYSRNHSLIIHGDAFDFKYYHRFNIIYMYCPIRDRDNELKLETLIENKMAVGAILICNLKQNRDIAKDNRFTQISERFPLWVKISARKQ